MGTFGREAIEQVVAACQSGQGEAALAFGRMIDQSVELAVGEASAFDVDQLPEECRGAGLILVLRVQTSSALLVLPASSGLLPDWGIQPDATGNEKLNALAVELGSLLLPESFPVTDGAAGYVRDLSAALSRSGLSADSTRVAMQIQSGAQSGTLSLIWPASQADAALHELDTSKVEQAASPGGYSTSLPDSSTDFGPTLPGGARGKPVIQYEELEDGILQLPAYSRSLLKIKVPVMVTLAESKQPVENVLAIGPGSIIHFNKPCEDSLSLEIDGQKIALGEAVKVGDKFGLWITSMILPEERFWVISDRPGVERAK